MPTQSGQTLPQSNEAYELKKMVAPMSTVLGITQTSEKPLNVTFQKLNVAGLDYQGQLSYAFGRFGKSVSIEFSSNLANLIPFLGAIGVDLSIKATVKGQREAEMMSIIQKMPSKVGTINSSDVMPMKSNEVLEEDLDTGEIWIIDSRGTKKRATEEDKERLNQKIEPLVIRPKWTTETPINYITLSGKRTFFESGVSFSAGFDPPFPKFSDSLTVEVSVSLNASAKIGMEIINLNALNTPTFYPSLQEDRLDGTAKIQDIVDNTLFTLTDEEIESIKKYIEELSSNQQDTSFLTKFFSFIKQKAGEVAKKVRDLTKSDAEKRKELVQTLETKINALRQQGTSELKPTATLPVLEKYHNSLKKFLQQLEQEGHRVRIEPSIPYYLNNYSSFSWFGGANLTAEASAGASVNINIPKPDGETAKKVNAQLKARIESVADANFKNVTYRFQSSNVNEKGEKLICTQDIYIAYRSYKVQITAEATAAIQNRERTGQKQFIPALYNTMTYLSVRNFWIYPSSKTERPIDVVLEERSGFSYGMSVSVDELIRCYKGENPKLKKAISKQLRVQEPEIEGFLSAAKIGEFKKQEEETSTEDPSPTGAAPKPIPPSTPIPILKRSKRDEVKPKDWQKLIPSEVFIESTFIFPDNTKLKLEHKEEGQEKYYHAVDSIKTNGYLKEQNLDLSQEHSPILESIRLRARIQDIQESSEVIFKRGLNLKVVNIEAQFSKSRGSGLEGFFDLYVHWYHREDYNTQSEKAKEAQELSVPPTILIHQ